MRVVVASKNPIKIQAVQKAFEQVFQVPMVFEGFSVPSGVSDQPMTDAETFKGALNRLKVLKESVKDADYWVGLEGGIIVHGPTEYEAMAWIVIMKDEKISKSRTASFYLPLETIKLIDQGLELGAADEQLHGVHNSKQSQGTTGILTKGLLNRAKYYEQSVILALIPFINKHLDFKDFGQY
jgi:inosine/xanthosine triphosphatase